MNVGKEPLSCLIQYSFTLDSQSEPGMLRNTEKKQGT